MTRQAGADTAISVLESWFANHATRARKKKHAASPTKEIDEIISAVPARMQHLSHRMQPPNDTIETRRVADKRHAPQLPVRDCAMQAARLFGTRSEEYTINNITPVVCRHAGTRHHQCRKHEDLKHVWPHVSYATNLRISERNNILTTQRHNKPPCAGSKAASDTLPPSDQQHSRSHSRTALIMLQHRGGDNGNRKHASSGHRNETTDGITWSTGANHTSRSTTHSSL